MIGTQTESTDPKVRTQPGGFCNVFPECASLLRVDIDRMIALNIGNTLVSS